MILKFCKYQGAGNDFVLIDNRNNQFDVNDHSLVSFLCDRRFGIGGDGLMLLQKHESFDFEMVYYNSDGGKSTMCGNGGRCITAFASHLGIIKERAMFIAADGPHEAFIKGSQVKLQMKNVTEVEKGDDFYYLNTGSPHYVKFVKNLDTVDVVSEGREIRNNTRFKTIGTNVNFVEIFPQHLKIRTYERGVEDETLACGTGITASSIAAAIFENTDKISYNVMARGGNLSVNFQRRPDNCFENVWLEGPAKLVFEGKISI